jgi:hypothetical protein
LVTAGGVGFCPAGDGSGRVQTALNDNCRGTLYTGTMVAAIRQVVTVGPGGVVQVTSPQLEVGARAEVIVLIERPDAAGLPQPAGPSMTSFIGAGKGCFSTVDDVDAFIRTERDAWDR